MMMTMTFVSVILTLVGVIDHVINLSFKVN